MVEKLHTPPPDDTPKTVLPAPDKTGGKMKTLLKFSIIALVVLVVIAGITRIFDNSSSRSAVITPETVARVEVTDQGFVPATLTVKAGTVVEWSSTDGTTSHIIAANPYPTSSDLPDLVSPQMGSGAKYRYTFNKAGTIKYHDKLKPTVNGTIIVQ
jgi:plastocyanin